MPLNSLALIHLRLRARRALRDRGYKAATLHQAMSLVDEDLVNEVAAEAEVPLTALGDGTIFQAIIDFFKSPEGQALLKALVEMLISLLAGL